MKSSSRFKQHRLGWRFPALLNAFHWRQQGLEIINQQVSLIPSASVRSRNPCAGRLDQHTESTRRCVRFSPLIRRECSRPWPWGLEAGKRPGSVKVRR